MMMILLANYLCGSRDHAATWFFRPNGNQVSVAHSGDQVSTREWPQFQGSGL